MEAELSGPDAYKKYVADHEKSGIAPAGPGADYSDPTEGDSGPAAYKKYAADHRKSGIAATPEERDDSSKARLANLSPGAVEELDEEGSAPGLHSRYGFVDEGAVEEFDEETGGVKT